MKCDICGIEYAKGMFTGAKMKILTYEEHQNRLTKRWRVVRRHRTKHICQKCLDTLNGLIISYRRR